MGTEARLEDAERAAWSALKEWLGKDQAGQGLLTQLLADPRPEPGHWRSGFEAPTSPPWQPPGRAEATSASS